MAKPLQHLGPSSQMLSLSPSGGPPADIIELIMADHRRIRRLCESLDAAIRLSGDSGSGWMPGHVWERLAGLLEWHTRAEEEICYLPMFQGLRDAARQSREAIADHDDIREAISEASLQTVSSMPWWRCVRAVVATSIDHLDREEREVLSPSLLTLTPARRYELGRQWCAFLVAWRLDAGPADGPAARGRPTRDRSWRPGAAPR